MPSIAGPWGRLLIAATLILFCVAVGLAVVLGSGGNQPSTGSGFGDLAATVEARRTANAPTATPSSTPTPQPIAHAASMDVALDESHSIPLLTISNQGYSQLAWQMWGVYRSSLGSATPLQVAVLGADAFDTFLLLEADAELARDFRFVNGGDDWTTGTIAPYDLLVVSEPEGGLSQEEMAALVTFHASGRGLILGIGQIDNLAATAYTQVNAVFGVDNSAPQAFVPNSANPAYPVGQGMALSQLSDAGSLHLTSAQWVVQGQSGATFVAAREDQARTLVFGGSLAEWLVSNPGLVQSALRWVGNSWLFLKPLSGQVPAQSSQVVTGLLDTSGFFAGSHLVDVVVESNDPATPRLRLPIQLQVRGEPRLGVQPGPVEFGDVYVGYDRVREIVVENLGVAALEVTLTAGDSTLHLQPDHLQIGPRARQVVAITFRPRLSQTVSSLIRLVSNDPISPTWSLPVTAQGVIPPIIALAAVDSELTLTRTFTTTNAQLQIGPPQVERPTPSPTATISPTLSIPSSTPTPGGPVARPTQAGEPTPTLHATAAVGAAPTTIAIGTPIAQPSVVATHSNASSSTATPGSTPDAPLPQVFARSAAEGGAPILVLPEGDAAMIGLLGPEAIFSASARTQATDWLYGHTTGITLTGWIAVQQLVLIGDPQRLPIQNP